MSGDDDQDAHPMTGRGDSTDAWLRHDVARFLLDLVEQDEFAGEIQRLALDPWDVVKAMAGDPVMMELGRGAYGPLEDRHDEREQLKRERPEQWVDGWRLNRTQRRALCASVTILAGLILLLVAAGAWLPTMVAAIVVVVAGAAAAVLAVFGLPANAFSRLLWVVEYVRLTAGLPAEWLSQRLVLRDRVIAPELRKWLHRQSKTSFALELCLRDASGLSLPVEGGTLVETSAVQACTREVNREMPGAVGLAGTRGAGKSTIIEQAARNRFTSESRSEMLGVITSAPVRYDARDFVLHIHACVCRAVIDHLAEYGKPTGSETERQWEKLYRSRFRRAYLGSVVRAAGRAVLWLAVAFGIGAIAWGWPHDYGFAIGRGALTFVQDVWESPFAVLRNMTWQLAAAAVSVFIAVRVGWMLLRKLVWPPVVGTALGVWRLFRRSRDRRPPEYSALRGVAEQQLRAIRFLQTHTNGWSGKIAVPLGSDTGVTRSLARTEQPWTHPEVVTRLRDFLTLVVEVLQDGPARRSGVVVAIDELDKISDPGEAHQFLNEIKGIFGVKHCLFLVAVSDDALTAFERRGIPARDAFDSAFTTMIHVQPFTLDESRTWLALRALGIPEPFVWLCHCLSGGLPRDLGRVAIALHDLQGTYTHLADITHSLIRQDMSLKARAFVHTAVSLSRTEKDDPSQSHILIKNLQDVHAVNPLNLDDLAHRIWPSGNSEPVNEFDRLCSEAACYLLFCHTLIVLFRDELDPGDLRLRESASDLAVTEAAAVITQLALVRQTMAVDTSLARQRLAEFRERLKPALFHRVSSARIDVGDHPAAHHGRDATAVTDPHIRGRQR